MTGRWRIAIAVLVAAAGILGSGLAADAQHYKQKQMGPKPAPRAVAPRAAAPKIQMQKQIQINRNVKMRGPAGPQNFQVKKQVVPAAGPKLGLRAVGPGVGKTYIKGQNYSVWRGGPYRKRYGGGWRTFVALGTLAAITVGAASYYPYAYIDAPADYCQGLTEDGCQLRWAEVPTVEGYPTYQCVAYCPWQ